MIFDAHGAASISAFGRHDRMRVRLGVSERPVDLGGPRIGKSRRWGAVVMPVAEPICVSASVCSIGEIRSSTIACDFGMNAAEMRCGPALIAIASVLMFMPFGELSLM